METLTKLGNKISLSIDKFVTDPEAEAIAAEKERKEVIEQKKVEDAKQKEEQKKQEAIKEAEVKRTDFDVIKEIAIKTIVSIIGVFIILFFGSIVSNAAIHRHIAVRLLYFIYGAIGGSILIFVSIIFPPLILLGILINVILYKVGYIPHLYAFMPLTTTPPSDNFISRIFKAPFYWDPESSEHKQPYLDALSKYKQFLESQLMKSNKA